MTDAAIVWEGAEELRPNLVPIRELVRHPQNPRRGRVALIVESLGRFGQVRPILTDGHHIIAGNHTFLAAGELGWTHIAVVRNEFASEEEARAYLLADNRLPELGDYDNEQLLPLLEELEEADAWTGTGYDIDDLEDLRALQNAVPQTDAQEFGGGFAITAEELLERERRLKAGTAYNDLVLTLTGAEGVEFDAHTRILKQEYGVSGLSDIVLRAVTEQAGRV